MMTKKNQLLYQKASEALSLINQTWKNVPAESVPFLVCNDLKLCMKDLLNCFLLYKTGELSSATDLSTLITQCAAVDQQFQQIDLRWINCKDLNLKKETDVFCSSIEHVQICTWIANGIKKVIDEEIKKNEVTTA